MFFSVPLLVVAALDAEVGNTPRSAAGASAAAAAHAFPFEIAYNKRVVHVSVNGSTAASRPGVLHLAGAAANPCRPHVARVGRHPQPASLALFPRHPAAGTALAMREEWAGEPPRASPSSNRPRRRTLRP